MVFPFLNRKLAGHVHICVRLAAVFLLGIVLFAGQSFSFAGEHAGSSAKNGAVSSTGPEFGRSAKTALVLATFGTSATQIGDPLALVKAELARRHPDLPVFVAYTSSHVLKTLRARQNREGRGAADPAGNDTPRTLAEVLSSLSAQGHSQVVVQSLQVTPGKEFSLVSDIASRFNALPKGLERVTVGLPLIGDAQDARTLAAVLTASAPSARKPDEAVVYVGHGADGAAGTLAYPALQAFLWERDPLSFVGIIEGKPDASDLLATLRAKGVKKVWLVPLLTVAGVHAAEDIFGNTESWRHTFTSAGIAVEAVERGLLQIPAVAALWADHVDAALQ